LKMGMESPRRLSGPGFGGTAPRIVSESPGPRTGRTRVTVSAETVTARRSPGADSDPEAFKFTVYLARPAQLHRCRAHRVTRTVPAASSTRPDPAVRTGPAVRLPARSHRDWPSLTAS
jgi:hypothetical protein